MARRRRSAALITTPESEFAEIIEWYEDRLRNTAPPTGLKYDPVKIGPTWDWDPNTGWRLPEHTLGWRVLAWCGRWLRDDDGRPWQFTMEQARFILWFFAVGETGDFLYHSAVLQRLKGWGKDPVAACLALAACFAEVTFDHWDGERPVGREETSAWVQIIAVSQDQTKNTMKLFPSLVPPETRRHYGIQVGKLAVYGLGGSRQIEAVTASPLAIEGGRPTLAIRNETQNWNASNGGFEMAGALEGNAAKSKNGRARILDVCNAYRPSEESVGRRRRETYEKSVNNPDLAIADLGLLYDSLEAPPDAPLNAKEAPAVLEAVRGDSIWLPTKPGGRIVQSILDEENPPSESRRKWFNQITAAEDDWMQTHKQWENSAAKLTIDPDDKVVLFFDGSKSDDATALVGCRISDGYVFTLGVWERPPHAKTWLIDRDMVDHRVRQAFADHNVVGFWADLSHARDDESGERYWESHCDRWAADFRRQLRRFPAVKSGPSMHLVSWDMSVHTHQKMFVDEAERFITDVAEESFKHDGHKLLSQHVKNAKRNPGKWGVSLCKDHRESPRKIDAAVCAVGARMMRRLWLAQNPPRQKRPPGRALALR